MALRDLPSPFPLLSRLTLTRLKKTLPLSPRARAEIARVFAVSVAGGEG